MVTRSLGMTLALWVAALGSYGQIAEDFLIGGHIDMVKTDYSKLLDKAQFGAEVNYFATKSITATAGVEYWTADGISFLVGTRWYPADNAFVRLRGLVGANDISLGGGWTKNLNNDWRFEAIGDFYFKVDFAIRVGVAYIIRKK